MLKSKKSLYVLLPVVAIIWGLIIYQVVDAFSPEDAVGELAVPIKSVNINAVQREKFTIGSVDRDPFLGTLYRPKPKLRKTVNTRKKPTVPIQWPAINYEGMVTGKGKSPSVYILNISGNSQLLQATQKAGEVLLVKGNAAQVTVKFKNATKTIAITK